MATPPSTSPLIATTVSPTVVPRWASHSAEVNAPSPATAVK